MKQWPKKTARNWQLEDFVYSVVLTIWLPDPNLAWPKRNSSCWLTLHRLQIYLYISASHVSKMKMTCWNRLTTIKRNVSNGGIASLWLSFHKLPLSSHVPISPRPVTCRRFSLSFSMIKRWLTRHCSKTNRRSCSMLYDPHKSTVTINCFDINISKCLIQLFLFL